tara:strand:+ start:540 stop:641 length:102 start_codon:yes stop_codon:yes gene_type:complete
MNKVIIEIDKHQPAKEITQINKKDAVKKCCVFL